MTELGQQTVEFSTLVSRAAEDSFLSLKELVDKSKTTQQSDSDKKISLLKYLVHTQQRMLRLNVLAKWCQQVKKIFFFAWLGFCVKELIWFTLNSVCLHSLSLLNGANRSIIFFFIGWRRKFWVFALDLNTFEFRVCWDFYVLKNCGCKEWRIEFLGYC